MPTRTSHLMRTCYEGGPTDKLATARVLHAELAGRLTARPPFADELDLLCRESEALARQMQAMELGRLCSRCATRPDGGCCSAFMAANTDALQILINLLLGASVAEQPDSGDNCCFLGPRGCLFLIKPIFCLNYNCTHILTGADPTDLAVLDRRAAAVLSRQTRIEDMLLEVLRDRTASAP